MATCEWRQDDPWIADVWETTCGEAFCFIDSGPTENRMQFCCYCGKALHAIPFQPPPEEAEADDAVDPVGEQVTDGPRATKALSSTTTASGEAIE